MRKSTLVGILWLGALNLGAQIQALWPVAITEVMAETTTNQQPVFKGVDYFEIKNFGNEDIDLDGWAFSDDRKTDLLVYHVFTNLTIQAGESIIFFRIKTGEASVTNAESFGLWWGETNLPSNLQIRWYDNPGFNGDPPGDSVWLYDAQGNVVDWVSFGQSLPGRSFVYDPDTGGFGLFNSPGDVGAFKAASTDDIGSPGVATEPIALRILRQPAAQTNNAGTHATFTVEAAGLPRPKLQWLFEGIEIPGATEATLILSNVTPNAAGTYQVRLYNSFMQATSAPVSLVLNTNPECAVILRPPASRTVIVGQVATFSVEARGYPLPQFQWYTNGAVVAEATDSTFSITDCSLELSGTVLTVQVWNDLCTNTASATLTVIPRPQFQVTEIMAWPTNKSVSGHADWFELTNVGNNAVDLKDWWLADTQPLSVEAFANYKLRRAVFRITNSVVIQPRESVIFIDTLPPEVFRRWWGSNLPPCVQIISWLGFSISSTGEQLYLWNDAAIDPMDTVAAASWAGSFQGISLQCTNICYAEYGCIGSCLVDSVLGQNGAWRATEEGDIGSPGISWVSAPNRSPVAVADKLIVLADRPSTIPASKLLDNDLDPDCHTLALTWVDANTASGGSVTLANGMVVYTPKPGYTGDDSFTYTIADQHGGAANGEVSLLVRAPAELLLPVILAPEVLPNGRFRIRFAGLPDYAYTIQSADTVQGPWKAFSNAVAGPNGVLLLEDSIDTAAKSKFYRLVVP